MRVQLDKDTQGTVTSVGSVIDPRTRSAVLRATLPSGPSVVAGRTASITLMEPAPDNAVSVPEGAVVSLDEKDVVFVRSPSGASVRQVKVAGHASGQAVITTGLTAGESVAASGTSDLKALAGAR
jgi:membrane fusion protein, heavy metal efflux system